MALITPNKLNPTDALATFFGLGAGDGAPDGIVGGAPGDAQTFLSRSGGAADGPYSDDPSLQLARLRGTRESELKARLPGEQATGDNINGARDLANLFQVQGNMASAPDTGVAAQQRASKAEDEQYQIALHRQPEFTDAADAATAAKIKEARGLSEANAEGPLAASVSPVGKAAAAQKAQEAQDLLAAKFGLESKGLVGSSPVRTTPEGVKWQDASAFPHGNLNSALQAAQKAGTRLVTDKNDVQSLSDNDAAQQTLGDIKHQLISMLPADAQSRPAAYLTNTLGALLQTNEKAAAYKKTITPRATDIFRAVSGMHGAGGMRMGPGMADLAQKLAPEPTDTLGTVLDTIDQLGTALKNHRNSILGGTVGGQSAQAPSGDSGNGNHVVQDQNGNFVPAVQDANGNWVPAGRR